MVSRPHAADARATPAGGHPWHRDGTRVVVDGDGRDAWGLPAVRVVVSDDGLQLQSLVTGRVLAPSDPALLRIGLVAVHLVPVAPYVLTFHSACLVAGDAVFASADPRPAHRHDVRLFRPRERRPLGLVPEDRARWLRPRLMNGEEIIGLCLRLGSPDDSGAPGATFLLGGRPDVESLRT